MIDDHKTNPGKQEHLDSNHVNICRSSNKPISKDSEHRNIDKEQRTCTTTTSSTNSNLSRWSNISGKLKKTILYLFKNVADFSARNPFKVLVSLTIISIALLLLGFVTNFELITSNHDLFTPFGSLTETHQRWIENESNYTAVPGQVIINVNAGGKNVLGVEGLSRVFQIVDNITNMEAYYGMCKSGEANQCKLRSVIDLWPSNSSIFLEKEIPISKDEAIKTMSRLRYPNGEFVHREHIFGNSEPLIKFENESYSEEDVRLENAESFIINLKYQNDGNKKIGDFEEEVSDLLARLRKQWSNNFSDWSLEYITHNSIESEMKRAIGKDIILGLFAFATMFVLCALYFFRKDLVRSRSILGVGAVLTILLSMMATFGTLFCIGVPFTTMTTLLPFIMSGIGLDDAFIITGSFLRTDRNLEVVSRIRQTMDEIGMSIFLSTTTTFLAFMLSSTSKIPAVRWFCFYAAPCVFVDFLFQISFFISFLVYDQRRIDTNRLDILCCITDHKTRASHENEIPKKKAWSTEEFMANYLDILFRPLSKVAVLLLFSFLFLGGILSAIEMKQYFDFTMLVPDDSFVKGYFIANDKYTSSSPFHASIIFRGIDFSVEENRKEMRSFINELVRNCTYITKFPDFFWVDDFERFISSDSLNENLHNLDFNDQLKAFLSISPFNSVYNSAFAWNEAGTVTTSNVVYRFDDLERSKIENQIVALSELREVTRNSPLNKSKDQSSVFSHADFFFNWEFSSVVLKELRSTAIFVLVSVFILSLMFIPHPSGALFVTSTVAVIFVELVGLLRYGGFDINVFTTVMLVMAIGLSVDFVMHIVHAYFESSAPTRQEKMYTAMMTMGSSLMVAGLSTLFGTLLLAFASTELGYMTFLTFVGIVTLGVTHSLIFIPVVLSVVGPLYNPKNPSFHVSERTT